MKLNLLQDLLLMSKGVRRFIASESLLGIGIGIFILVFNLHLLEIGFNEAEIGKISSLGTIIIGIFAIPSSLLANRFGRKKLLVIGLLLMGIGYGGVAIGQKFSMFYLSQMIISVGITLLITSEIQLLFHYSQSKKEETQAFSVLFAVFTLFTGVGTLLGGFIPKWLGGNTSIYQSSLFLSSFLLILVAIIRGLFLPKEERKENAHLTLFSVQHLKYQLKNRSIWIFSFLTFLTGMAFAFVIPFLNVIVKFRYGLNDEWVSLLLTVNGFFLFLGSLLVPYILERWGIDKTYFVIYLSNILLSFLIFFSLPLGIFASLLLIRGGSFTMLNNVVESQTMQATEEENRNLFAGLRSVTRSLGAALSTYFAGIIMSQKDYSLPFLLSGISLLTGYLFFLIWVKPLLKDKLEDSREGIS